METHVSRSDEIGVVVNLLCGKKKHDRNDLKLMPRSTGAADFRNFDDGRERRVQK